MRTRLLVYNVLFSTCDFSRPYYLDSFNSQTYSQNKCLNQDNPYLAIYAIVLPK